jgi:hypothetical protein
MKPAVRHMKRRHFQRRYGEIARLAMFVMASVFLVAVPATLSFEENTVANADANVRANVGAKTLRLVFATPAAFAKDGEDGGSSGSGSAGESGPSENSGPGNTGQDDAEDNGVEDGGPGNSGRHGKAANQSGGSLTTFLGILKGHGKVADASRESGRIAVKYTDGWSEQITGGKFQLVDPKGRIVASRQALQVDVRRLQAAAGD